jgi:catechol 2,3-dioxygenase-like lactoylglutathione lyase family enzyme
MSMISGAHFVIFSKEAEADRAFFRDILGFKSVDAGHGWLIFALPPAEAAFHPADENGGHEFYLMCDDLQAEMASLAKKKVRCSEIGVRRSRRRDGASSRSCGFPVAARSAFISRNTPRR